MQVAIQVPIKKRPSTRVPNKNFRELCGKPLACWLLDELVANLPQEWDIFIDSESESVFDQFKERYGEKFKYHKRDKWYAADQANGNHLINQFAILNPDYDIYVQAFVTAVTLNGELIRESIDTFINSLDQYDSMLLVTEETGWYWYNDQPLNYDTRRPDGLPRSQDALLLKETTGLYAITRDACLRTGCRIGHHPLFFKVPRKSSLDVDTVTDLAEAQRILSLNKHG